MAAPVKAKAAKAKAVTPAKGKSAAAPGQRKKALGLKSAKTLTKGYTKSADTRSEAVGTARSKVAARPAASGNAFLNDVGRGLKGVGDAIGGAASAVGGFIGRQNAQATGNAGPNQIRNAMAGAPAARAALHPKK